VNEMARKKHIIWSSDIGDINDWHYDNDEDLSEETKYEMTYEDNAITLDDERMNLNIQLDNPILIIASLGLWDGRRSGYKIIQSGKISDILYSDCDDAEWYTDGYNVKCIARHHDGTNYYEYREIKDMNNIDKLTDKLYNNEDVDRDLINRYTRSIVKHVNKVYGW
jgi:hypothetical protein